MISVFLIQWIRGDYLLGLCIGPGPDGTGPAWTEDRNQGTGWTEDRTDQDRSCPGNLAQSGRAPSNFRARADRANTRDRVTSNLGKKKKNIAQIQSIDPVHRSDRSNPGSDRRPNLAKAWTEDWTEEDRSGPVRSRIENCTPLLHVSPSQTKFLLRVYLW